MNHLEKLMKMGHSQPVCSTFTQVSASLASLFPMWEYSVRLSEGKRERYLLNYLWVKSYLIGIKFLNGVKCCCAASHRLFFYPVQGHHIRCWAHINCVQAFDGHVRLWHVRTKKRGRGGLMKKTSEIYHSCGSLAFYVDKLVEVYH